jgi:hypothetical protein
MLYIHIYLTESSGFGTVFLPLQTDDILDIPIYG